MIEAELPDGTVLEFPEGTSTDVIQRVVKQRLGSATPQPAPKEPSFGQQVQQQLANLGGGMVRGAGSIGATLLAPVDAAARAMGIQNSIIGRNDRREAMTGALQQMGADPNSLAFQAGKIGSEVAGTAGVGGAMAKGAQALGAAPSIVQALRSGGMAGGTLGQRVGAGALTGMAAGGAVNPDEAMTGALAGGAVPMVGPALRGAGNLARQVIGGTTGVGDEALRQAFVAGRQGGQASQSFAQNMRGTAPMDDVLTAAKQNLQAMGQQRQQAYREGMANVKADKSVLSFDGVDDAISKARNMATFKGQAKNVQAAEAVQRVSDEIAQWKALDPAEFHTPEGLDALKQRIGGIMESIPFEQKTARTAVGGIYDSIKSEVSKQAPEYSKVMRDYSEATDLIREIEKSLSLGQKASADTAMRKLQSLMRNNVNTSYGFRDELAQQMQQAGGQNIMPALAGQALSDVMPRGLQRAGAATGGAGLAVMGNVPAAAALGAVSSPRLMGETFYGAGRAANLADQMVSPALVEMLRRGAGAAAPVIAAQ
jgi:hypothetical protein